MSGYGGSVYDAYKARKEEPTTAEETRDFLEIVGTRVHYNNNLFDMIDIRNVVFASTRDIRFFSYSGDMILKTGIVDKSIMESIQELFLHCQKTKKGF